MWKELFNMQEVLDNKIHEEKGLTREETFHKRILALLVEVGEMMNEHRSFKYWSEDQVPRTRILKRPAMNEEDKEYKNPLLEEYVDCIHFLLSIGNDLAIQEVKYIEPRLQKDLTGQVIDLYNMISILQIEQKHREKMYHAIFSHFIRIGQQMGFTMEQVHEAYKSKNEVNFERLESGY